jgi:hypothetical protein
MPKKFREIGFPNIRDAFQTSPATQDYNCVAWALEINDEFWWPKPAPDYYWPDGVPREETKEAFIRVFEIHGYTEVPLIVSGSEKPPAEVERIAIFVKSGEITHVARQMRSGKWTSKMANDMDMTHDLDELVPGYGAVSWIMERPRPNQRLDLVLSN